MVILIGCPHQLHPADVEANFFLRVQVFSFGPGKIVLFRRDCKSVILPKVLTLLHTEHYNDIRFAKLAEVVR